MTTIVLIYGFLGLLYCGAAIFAQKDAINEMTKVSQLVGFTCALVLLSAVWPVGIILDIIVWKGQAHK